MCCRTCPFAYTDESEQVQNYGCLPTPQEIMCYKRDLGKNWACHNDPSRMCAGFVETCAEHGVDYKAGTLASYEQWCQTGAP